jgi:hypothetical protein
VSLKLPQESIYRSTYQPSVTCCVSVLSSYSLRVQEASSLKPQPEHAPLKPRFLSFSLPSHAKLFHDSQDLLHLLKIVKNVKGKNISSI